MSYLAELSATLDKAQAETAAELWPTQAVPQIPPAALKVIAELGDDTLLAEAALVWIRQKKQEAIGALLGTYYTAEQLEAMRQKALEGAT